MYIHTPFCLSKCPYCDFYSAPPREESALERYTAGVIDSLHRWGGRLCARADTLYFGGGTPSLLGGRRLGAILRAAEESFSLFSADRPEITLEANPADDLQDTLAAFAAAGGNRLSLGMQSAVPTELAALGRRHTPADVVRTVQDAHRAGLTNISLDIMLGISGQTVQTVRQSVDCAAALGAQHASAYLLRVEPDTPYGHCPPPLPDEDAAADLYLAAMQRLDEHGYRQYEISNTAQPGAESRHNLKYWDSRPYLGIGPAAASYIRGRRFTYPRDTRAFLAGSEPVEETDAQMPAGSPEEYAMLRLRLTEGLSFAAFRARFGAPVPAAWAGRAAALPPALVQADAEGIRLTRQGFLLSNTLLCHILAG